MRRTLSAFALLLGMLLATPAPAGAATTHDASAQPTAAARAETGAPRAHAGATGSRAEADAARVQAGHADGRVALVGVPGLRWSDLSERETPNLWRLAGRSALGSLSVRAVGRVTCPYDGWLTVSAGVRSAVGYWCGPPPAPEPSADGGAVIPDYGYLHAVAGQKHAGTLGEALRAAGQCGVAIGPGAGLALADRAGRIGVYAASLADLRPGALTRCRVVAADVDDLIRPYLATGTLSRTPEPLTAAQRAVALRQADAKVGAVLAALPAGTEVLLAGLADHDSEPHLRAAMLERPGAAGRLLGAASTHREDITILPDITATLLTGAGVQVPANVVGTPWRVADTRTGPVAEAVAALDGADVAGQTIRRLGGGFFTALAVLQVLFYAVAFFLLRRRRALDWLRSAALVLASLPVATYLVNLTPWGQAGMPLLALVGGILGCAVVLGAVALSGPWRERPLGPLAVVTGVTAAVLAGDLLTGTTLQLNSVMGYTAVVGARYYGLGNIPFALLATSVLLTATVLAHWLIGRGRRDLAVGCIVALGGLAMILGGWPGVGSDFGGVIAFVPGIAVTAMMIAGRRLSLVKLAAFCVAGGVIVMAIAYLDYLRPPGSQTHLGRFVGQVFSGEALEVIGRKLSAMLGTLLSPNLMPIVLAAAAFLVFAVLRPGAATAGVLPAAFERTPALRAGFVGTLVSGVVGMLVNDSGAAVLSMALALAVPLVLSVGIKGWTTRPPAPPRTR
ncbi:hypothetical protein [Thermocatellispora tengchongensis]|uniref:hypothetical protein n=1 Tax=Thermocatellispora tengchongensis TaxID=1073253 RepID=UPI0036286FDF